MASSAHAVSTDYDCEFSGPSGARLFSGQMQLSWSLKPSYSPLPRKDLVGDGFLTIYTQPNHLLDVVMVTLPDFSKRGYLGGSKVSGSIYGPFNTRGFGGSFYSPDLDVVYFSCYQRH